MVSLFEESLKAARSRQRARPWSQLACRQPHNRTATKVSVERSPIENLKEMENEKMEQGEQKCPVGQPILDICLVSSIFALSQCRILMPDMQSMIIVINLRLIHEYERTMNRHSIQSVNKTREV